MLGCCSALVHLKEKDVLQNDIKSDILIERMPPRFTEVRAVLISTKHVSVVMLDSTICLSKKEYYAKHHPHIAPEVRNGIKVQSFESDIFSIGRIIDKVNVQAIGMVTCISSMVELRTSLQTFSSLIV